MYIKLPHWKSDISYIDPTHHWHFSLRSLEIFDPSTQYGAAYSFYTSRKWRIVKGPRLNDARSSIHATLEVIK